MWNPLKKIGGWIDSASNRIAENQFSDGGPVSAEDLSPAQKRAYLGMLISSIGSGVSALGAGRTPNVVGPYLASQNALNENYDSQIRQRKIREVLQSNLPLEEKIRTTAALGDERTAGILQRQWEMRQEQSANANRVTSTFQAVDPSSGKAKTFALFQDGSSRELGESPVENMPIAAGGRTAIIPRVGPAPQAVEHTAPPEALMNERIQQQRLQLGEQQQKDQRWYWGKMVDLQKLNTASQTNLERARTQREILETQQLAKALASTQDPGFAVQLAKLPTETQKALVMHQQALSNLDEIIDDMDKNGKLSVMDIMRRTPRGQRIDSLVESTIEYLKGPFGTGVLQAHEAERIKNILGSVESYGSLTRDKNTVIEGLKTTQKMVSKSIGAYVMLLQNKLPPDMAAAYQSEAVAEFEKSVGKRGRGKTVRVVVDPKTNQWRIVNE